LEAREGNRVLGIVKQESELAALGPSGEPVGEIAAERVREHAESAKRRVDDVEAFDLVIEVALRGRVKVPGLKTFRKRARKSRFSFVGGSEKGLILKSSEARPARTYEPPNRCVRLSKLPPRSKIVV
jgi:hypothetical protein